MQIFHKDNARRFLKECENWFNQNPDREFRLVRVPGELLRVISRWPVFVGALEERRAYVRGAPRWSFKNAQYYDFQVIVRKPPRPLDDVQVLVGSKIVFVDVDPRPTKWPEASREEGYCREMWALHTEAASRFMPPEKLTLRLFEEAAALVPAAGSKPEASAT